MFPNMVNDISVYTCAWGITQDKRYECQVGTDSLTLCNSLSAPSMWLKVIATEAEIDRILYEKVTGKNLMNKK